MQAILIAETTATCPQSDVILQRHLLEHKTVYLILKGWVPDACLEDVLHSMHVVVKSRGVDRSPHEQLDTLQGGGGGGGGGWE